MKESNETEIDPLVLRHLAKLRVDAEWSSNPSRGLALLRQRRASVRRDAQRRLLVASFAGILCVALLASPSARASAGRFIMACVEKSSLISDFFSGTTTAASPSRTYVRQDARRIAPDFALKDISGRPVRLSNMRGKVVLLSFWDDSCSQCTNEIPWFMGFLKAQNSRGLAALGVSMAHDAGLGVAAYVSREGMNYPVAIGGQEIADLYGGLKTLPATMVIDKYGRIAALHIGLCTRAEFEGDIATALSEE